MTILSTNDAARVAGISHRSIQRVIKEGRLPATTDGDGRPASVGKARVWVLLAVLVVMLAFPCCDRFRAGILNPPDPCRN